MPSSAYSPSSLRATICALLADEQRGGDRSHLDTLLAQLSKPVNVTVEVYGGCVTRVVSDSPTVSVEVLDHDGQGEPEEGETLDEMSAAIDARVKAGTLYVHA